jgi:hypothetical protein
VSGESQPRVYADISKSAQENAVSFDGIRGIFGVHFMFPKFGASIAERGNFTEHNFNIVGVNAGVGYSKSFRKNFLLAIDIGTDICKKGKKEGDWNTLNREYERERGGVYHGERSGKFESSPLLPNIALKCGYLFLNFKSVVFAKVSVSKVSGTYYYMRNGAKVCNADVSVYVPSIGVGIERKINKKWGASLEANMAIKRAAKKTEDGVEHKVRVGRKDLRIMGTYSFSHQ